MSEARARLSSDTGEVAHVGLRLMLAREERGVSLTEAAARTHIKEMHLAAIEAMDVAAFPGRPYALGFVKTYAEFLGLEPREAVEQFKFDAGYDAPAPIETQKFRVAEEAAESEPGGMSLPVFILILAFIIWCGWQITLTRKVTPIGGQNAVEESAQSAGSASAATVVEAPTPDRGLGEVMIAPKLIEQIEPVYPRSCTAAARPVETITVGFTVTAGGRIAAERIAASTNACFDEAALNAIRRWRFDPRTVDGVGRPAYDQTHSFSFARP